MNEDLYKNIRKTVKGHTTPPSGEVWRRLESKLDKKESTKTIYLYRNTAVVASIIAVFAIASLFYLQVESQHNPDLFSSNEEYLPMVLEDLDVESDPLYSASVVDAMHDVVFDDQVASFKYY